MIKNIIFDMSEVIISGYHGVEKILEQQYAIPEEEWERERLSKNELFLNLMRGNLSEEAYLEELLQGTNWNISIEQLKTAIRSSIEQLKTAIRSNLNRPVPGTMKVVRELKGKYQLILLSDYVREWMKYIEERNEDLRIFDKKIFSYNIGTTKSEVETFETVLEQTKIVADETLFIDDYEKNVKNAEAVGIHGIVFENADQLRKILSSEYNLLQVEKEYRGEDR